MKSRKINISSHVLAFIFTFIGCFLVSLKRDDGYDFFWYLGAGNIMHGASKVGESYTALNSPWHNHEWLFHWIIGLSSEPSLFHLLLKIILVLLIFITLFLSIRKSFPDMPYLAPLLTIIASSLSIEFLSLRAQLISYLLFIITWNVLCSSLSEFKKAIFVSIIMLIWANTHGAFVLGIALVVYHQLFVWFWFKYNNQKLPSYIWAPIFASLIMPLINPYGYEVYLYPIKWIGNDLYKEYIREWTSVVRWDSLFYPYLAYLIITIFILFMGKPIKRINIIPFIIFALLPLSAVRHLPFFYIFSSFVLIEALYNIENKIIDKYKGSIFIGNWKWVIAIFFILLFHVYSFHRYPILRFTDPIFQKYVYPTGAIAFMRDNDLDGRILNAYQWGGYLWWRDYDIFIDGRLDTLYPEDIFLEFVDVATANTNWENVLDKWNVNFILYDTTLKKQTPKLNEVVLKDDSWMILYQDPVSTLFAKKESLSGEFLDKFKKGEIAIPDEPMCQYAAGMTLYRRDGSYQEIRKYLERAIELDPAFAQPNLGLARLYIREKQYSNALTEIKRAIRKGLRGDEVNDLREIAISHL